MEAVRMAKPQPPIETEDVGKGQAMKLWDPIRSLWVDPTPEERVRQKWIRLMVGDLLFPKGLLSVEKDLASLPHLSLRTAIDPERRLDLLCSTPGRGGLIPLLLIECKAGPLLPSAERQVMGYNEAVGALFMAVVNEQQAKTFWREKEGIASVPFLPSYPQLVAQCL